MSNPIIEKFMTAVGALGEICGTMRDMFIANGFTREEAIYLVGEFINGFAGDITNKNGN